MTPSRRILLEVPIASLEDALAAQSAGADRLELNTALGLGGLTPSLGLLVETRQAVALPLLVMARPRPGGFCYRPDEFRVLQRDIDLLLAHGATGIAFGVLTASGEIDRVRVQTILRQIGVHEAVFHRAFDVTPAPALALEQLIDLGVKRILTSGQEESAFNGAARIAELRHQARGRIEVLPAGGINRFTVADVVARTGCDQVHASLRMSKADPSTAARPQVRFGAASNPPEDCFDATSADLVRQLRELLDRPGLP
jgi:copper homeostasis protein